MGRTGQLKTLRSPVFPGKVDVSKYRQMRAARTGLSIDWSRKSPPDYYKWTVDFLAVSQSYFKKEAVNWDPIDDRAGE